MECTCSVRVAEGTDAPHYGSELGFDSPEAAGAWAALPPLRIQKNRHLDLGRAAEAEAAAVECIRST